MILIYKNVEPNWKGAAGTTLEAVSGSADSGGETGWQDHAGSRNLSGLILSLQNSAGQIPHRLGRLLQFRNIIQENEQGRPAAKRQLVRNHFHVD